MARNKYYYRNKDGVLDWHDTPAPKFGEENKKKVDRNFGANGWSTGLSSVAASVHSSQTDEFRQDAKDHGFTGVDFKSDGTAVFSSRNERAKYLAHRGLYDRDAGYGDGAPRSF